MPSARQLLERAAHERGFRFQRELKGPGLPGMVFQAGSKVVASDVIDARGSATPFIAGGVIGLYAEDSSLPRMVASSFVAIPLERSVPNIVLFGKGIGALRRAGVAVGRRQHLSLEGDFDRHFTLYCPEGYERDALEIFTPDLMQLLLDTTTGCDVELVDDWMFVYARPRRYSTPDALGGLVAVTARVQAKIHRQTARYRDERAAPLAATGAAPLRERSAILREERAAAAAGAAAAAVTPTTATTEAAAAGAAAAAAATTAAALAAASEASDLPALAAQTVSPAYYAATASRTTPETTPPSEHPTASRTTPEPTPPSDYPPRPVSPADYAAASRTAPRTVSPSEYAEQRGRIAEGGRRVRTRASALQVVITVASTALLLGAAVRMFAPELVPWIP
jgi:hypothetical protein